MGRYSAVIVAALLAAVIGCDGSTDLSEQEKKAFKGTAGDGPRSDAAKAGIADFRKQFEEKHGPSGGPKTGPGSTGN